MKNGLNQKNVLIGGIYKHYKNQKLYKILATGHHSEDHQPYVIYQGLYFCNTFGDLPVWVRPLPLFLEIVEWEGSFVPRFELVQQSLEAL